MGQLGESGEYRTGMLIVVYFHIRRFEGRPHFQKIKCSLWFVLQVYTFSKILLVGKHLFRGSKQSSMIQFSDFTDFLFRVFLMVSYV
jgi:hypothetical protein